MRRSSGAAQEKAKSSQGVRRAQSEKFGINPKHKKQADEIEAFLNKAPKYEGAQCSAGRTCCKDLEDILLATSQVVRVWRWRAGRSGQVLNDFTTGADQHVILRAKNKRSVDIAEDSEFANEKEVLMPTGSRYSLKGVQKEEISPSLSKKGIYRWIIDLDQNDQAPRQPIQRPSSDGGN